MMKTIIRGSSTSSSSSTAISYSFCKPLKGISKHYWIGINLPPNIIKPIAYIQPSKYATKKDYEMILTHLHERANNVQA